MASNTRPPCGASVYPEGTSDCEGGTFRASQESLPCRIAARSRPEPATVRAVLEAIDTTDEQGARDMAVILSIYGLALGAVLPIRTIPNAQCHHCGRREVGRDGSYRSTGSGTSAGRKHPR